MNRLLLVDVDLVVAPSDVKWAEYLGKRFGYVKTPMVNYNFGSYYPTQDAYLYWRDLDYFSMQPIDGSVETLRKLSTHFNIVFASAEKCGYSSRNKKSWLKEHYPFKTGYISTEDKFLLDSERTSAVIDDRLSNLEMFPHHKRIQFNTPYTQDVQCEVEMSFDVWNDEIVTKICSRYL